MNMVSKWGVVTRTWRQAAIADTICGYLAAIEALEGLLNVRCSFIRELRLIHIAGRLSSKSVS